MGLAEDKARAKAKLLLQQRGGAGSQPPGEAGQAEPLFLDTPPNTRERTALPVSGGADISLARRSLESSAASRAEQRLSGSLDPTQGVRGMSLPQQFQAFLRGEEAPDEQPATTTFRALVQQDLEQTTGGKMRLAAGRATLPVMLAFLGGGPAEATLLGMMGVSANQVLDNEPEDVKQIAIAGLFDVLTRGAFKLGRQAFEAIGKRTPLAIEQANALIRRANDAMVRLQQGMNTQLQAKFKATQRVQNAFRGAGQQANRRARAAVTQAARENVILARDFVTRLPLPSQQDITDAYNLVNQFNIQLPTTVLNAAKRSLRESQELLAKVPGTASPRIQRLGREAEAVSSQRRRAGFRPEERQLIPETISFQEVRGTLTALGRQASSLKQAVSFGTNLNARSDLAATQTLISALEETLENAATSSTVGEAARTALKNANAKYKIFRTVEELGDLFRGSVTTRASDGAEVLSAGKLRNALSEETPSNTMLIRRLRDIDMLDSTQQFVERLAGRVRRATDVTEAFTRAPRARAPMQPGQDILGRARQDVRMQGLQIPEIDPQTALQTPSLTGAGLRAATVGTALGFSVSPQIAAAGTLAVSVPFLLARTVMSKKGQQLLLRLVEARGPVLDQSTITMLTQSLTAGARTFAPEIEAATGVGLF